MFSSFGEKDGENKGFGQVLSLTGSCRETVIKDFQNFPAVAIFDFESKERLGKERSNWGRRRVKKNTPFFSYFFSLFRLIRRLESGVK